MKKQIGLIVAAVALLGIGYVVGSMSGGMAFAGIDMHSGQTGDHMTMMKGADMPMMMDMMNTPGHKAMMDAMASGDTAEMTEACLAFMESEEGKQMHEQMMQMHGDHHK